jgi:hypothetical protein
MRVLPLLVALPFLTTFAPFSLAREPVTPPVLRLAAAPVPLSAGAPAQRRLGRLLFLEGWHLRSNDPRFGGISAMSVENGGVTALTDGARLYSFALPRGPGVTPLASIWLQGASGMQKELRDSEAMAVHGEAAWIAYERQNVVTRFHRRTWRPVATAQPRAMRAWSLNAGAEAMVRLADGRFLIFCEGRRSESGETPALLFHGDPADVRTRTTALRYAAPAGFRITEAAELPDGRLLFLNRRVSLFDGIQVKLTLSERPTLASGSLIRGREIAHFGPEVTTDNYEALSITREGGRTILWIASDDNFLAFQRTLLLKFELSA